MYVYSNRIKQFHRNIQLFLFAMKALRALWLPFVWLAWSIRNVALSEPGIEEVQKEEEELAKITYNFMMPLVSYININASTALTKFHTSEMKVIFSTIYSWKHPKLKREEKLIPAVVKVPYRYFDKWYLISNWSD